MMDVQEYKYEDFSNPQKENRPSLRPHSNTNFSAQTHRNVDEVAAIAGKAEHFRLDATVSSQLGIRERERADAEAEIKAELERRWEKTSEQAEVAGYTKGLGEGKAEAYKAELPRIAEKVEKLDFLLRELDTFREKIFSANEAFLMDLIAQVAGMVALKEISLDQDYVRRLVTALLKQLGTKEDLKIFLSPADYANASELFHQLEKEFGKLQNASVEPNEAIPVSGCRIETRFGVVDSSVVSQVDNLMKSIKG
jgi:flagellar assembly protein FliH